MNMLAPLLIGISFLAFESAYTQICADPKMRSYDTTIVGSGNSLHSLSFPKFDPSLGTLMEIKLESDITLTYSYQLENRENITINNYRVRVTREDEISGSALINPLTNSYIRTYGPYTLSPWDGVAGSGADYRTGGPLYVMNRAHVSQSVYNTADFLGPGIVNFDYGSTTYSSVLGSVNYTFNATAQDTIQFRITYIYCNTWFLKADISQFSATKKADIVDLQWITQNEEKERIYEIQTSYDGRDFETVDRKTSQPDQTQTGSYRHSYQIKPEDKHPKLIFRLRQIEKDGTEKFSAIRIIDLKQKQEAQLRVYPNPAVTQSTLIFNNIKRSNWDVELYNMNGTRVKQYRFNNALTGRIDGLELLPKGIYIIKATDRNTFEVRKQRFVIGK